MKRNPLGPLSKGERLWLWGRRWEKNNVALAKCFGVSKNTISKWLHAPIGEDERVPEVVLREPVLRHEIIALARRREGLSIRESAKTQGVSHVSLISRERGGKGVRRTWDYWQARGWPPPPGLREPRESGYWDRRLLS